MSPIFLFAFVVIFVYYLLRDLMILRGGNKRKINLPLYLTINGITIVLLVSLFLHVRPPMPTRWLNQLLGPTGESIVGGYQREKSNH
ncbi:hypothetical protein MJA45_23010 [Paenibacillus aurantius]|uniref:Uncharacterized protein n=1 Tax=Paenibacillus aurantius TaxID=2918900 RepID=A0AA96LF34_9BACL|nr:hypothetical protein [Paenibacillus aurantius]WNQ10457.1 hypothetical protein MJA45_23010 [Paenibacillus aurantius]